MLKKFITAIHSITLNVKFFLINLFSKKDLVLDESSGLHVSLTTYSKRLSRVYLTIESIFYQSTAPASVTLWLYQGDIINGLPNSIERLKKRGLQVRLETENIKSYKKLYYSYLEHRNNSSAKLVTVDDDIFYRSDMLSLLEEEYTKNKSVICFRGKYITLNESGVPMPYSSWPSNSDDGKSSFYLLPTGVGGVLYPISCLKGLDKHKELFLDLSPTADDIWFKFVTLSNNYSAHRVFEYNIHPVPHLSFDMKGLEKENVFNGKNDEQLICVMKFFNISLP